MITIKLINILHACTLMSFSLGVLLWLSPFKWRYNNTLFIIKFIAIICCLVEIFLFLSNYIKIIF